MRHVCTSIKELIISLSFSLSLYLHTEICQSSKTYGQSCIIIFACMLTAHLNEFLLLFLWIIYSFSFSTWHIYIFLKKNCNIFNNFLSSKTKEFYFSNKTRKCQWVYIYAVSKRTWSWSWISDDSIPRSYFSSFL